MIPITIPYLDEKERQAVGQVLESGWLTQGPRVAEFERAVAEYCGVEHAVAVSSCTAALHLAMLALDVGPRGRGDLPVDVVHCHRQRNPLHGRNAGVCRRRSRDLQHHG